MIMDSERPESAAEDGENYFVSMTDMMVGVLFIFIIMLMIFALEFRAKTDVQEDSILVARQVARKLDALQTEVRSQIGVLDEAQETRRRLLEDIRDQLRAEGLNVEIDEANGVLRLTEEAVRFETNRSDLTDRARSNVGKIARVLDRVLPKYAACRAGMNAPLCSRDGGSTVETVFVEGHTDISGLDDRNWQLSTERAVNTYREIVNVAPMLRLLRNRGAQEIVSVSGYASTRPIDDASTPEAWAKNRRIDLRFVMEVDSRQRLRQILELTDAMKVEIDRLKGQKAN